MIEELKMSSKFTVGDYMVIIDSGSRVKNSNIYKVLNVSPTHIRVCNGKRMFTLEKSIDGLGCETVLVPETNKFALHLLDREEHSYKGLPFRECIDQEQTVPADDREVI